MYEVNQVVSECFCERVINPSVPSNDAPDDGTMNKLLSALMEAPGLGTRCMEGHPVP